MAQIAKLGLKVDNRGALKPIDETKARLRGLGDQSARTEKKVSKLGRTLKATGIVFASAGVHTVAQPSVENGLRVSCRRSRRTQGRKLCARRRRILAWPNLW